MSRRIAVGRRLLGGGAEGGDDYFGRLAKYIPAEIVAVYLAAKAVVATDPDRPTLICVIFWACLTLTPIYLVFVTREKGKGPLWLQVLLATIAFPLWVLAIGGGCFAEHFDKRPAIVSLILIFVTFLFGIIKPPPEDQ